MPPIPDKSRSITFAVGGGITLTLHKFDFDELAFLSDENLCRSWPYLERKTSHKFHSTLLRMLKSQNFGRCINQDKSCCSTCHSSKGAPLFMTFTTVMRFWYTNMPILIILTLTMFSRFCSSDVLINCECLFAWCYYLVCCSFLSKLTVKKITNMPHLGDPNWVWYKV